ncbi:hypothetical protein VM94_05376 [Janthinobacterium sp. KBS0711]|uniref:LPS biosynthesis protein n=1 Tax=unclassified Janthinobacterium TaxID=2610881 RepID=UPI0006279632|nr:MULTISPECIES: LPS biosynthesis protein [unclassified Janthinobacterium]KKO61602.1 hypothetical protein VM94_05376 [Janthinobacterium sp. KBS0711]TSD73794.1 lipopolysaccharide biosynthesis protein [Janthinobacterium sp. KBS0711]
MHNQNTQDNQDQQDDFEDDNATPFTDMLAIAWRSRRTIISVTIAAVVIGVGYTYAFPSYKSEGFLQFGGAIPMPASLKERETASSGIVLADYKRYSAAFSTSGRLMDYIKEYKLEGQPGVDKLRRVFASRAGMGKLVEPVFPFTKIDAKELMEQPKDGGNNVIGLRITYDAATPIEANQTVALLGRYTMDSIIYQIYSDVLRFKHSEITARITKLENDIIDSNGKLEVLNRKGSNLKQIMARYPQSANQASREVISITEDNARYLPPATQLMTTEVEAAAENESIYKFKREQQKYQLLREYYDRAKVTLDNTKSGEVILRALEPLKQTIFKNKDMKNEVIQETFNMISIDNQNALNLYLEKSRFIAGPSLPENRSSRLTTTALASFIFGLLISLGLVFGRNWWKNNSSKMNG